MTEIVASLTSAFTLAFVITSMFGLGLALTVREILDPLKDVSLVLRSLVANFVVVPAIAWGLTRVIPLDRDLQAGLLLMSAVAGAPLSLKAAQLAGGDVPFSVSLIVLQVVATVVYLPLALPALLPGINVDAVGIAMPLVLEILLPLGLGLLMNARYAQEATMTRTIMSEVSNLSLAIMLVLNLGNVGQVIGLLGTGAILAVLIVIGAGFIAGHVLGGPRPATRRTLALGTGQRNFAAAFVIAGADFAHRPTVLIMLLAAALLSMAIVLPLAGELGRRTRAGAQPAATA